MAHVLRRTPTHSFLEWSPKVANLVVGSLVHSWAQIIDTLFPSERKCVGLSAIWGLGETHSIWRPKLCYDSS